MKTQTQKLGFQEKSHLKRSEMRKRQVQEASIRRPHQGTTAKSMNKGREKARKSNDKHHESGKIKQQSGGKKRNVLEKEKLASSTKEIREAWLRQRRKQSDKKIGER